MLIWLISVSNGSVFLFHHFFQMSFLVSLLKITSNYIRNDRNRIHLSIKFQFVIIVSIRTYKILMPLLCDFENNWYCCIKCTNLMKRKKYENALKENGFKIFCFFLFCYWFFYGLFLCKIKKNQPKKRL